jgi:hypothetical protein
MSRVRFEALAPMQGFRGVEQARKVLVETPISVRGISYSSFNALNQHESLATIGADL